MPFLDKMDGNNLLDFSVDCDDLFGFVKVDGLFKFYLLKDIG
ncbi:MAG: hypothetical protein N2712_06460 [Brevinematales bacterium]|nr:hypothetical protein [Brevinematales bacterium]